MPHRSDACTYSRKLTCGLVGFWVALRPAGDGVDFPLASSREFGWVAEWTKAAVLKGIGDSSIAVPNAGKLCKTSHYYRFGCSRRTAENPGRPHLQASVTPGQVGPGRRVCEARYLASVNRTVGVIRGPTLLNAA